TTAPSKTSSSTRYREPRSRRRRGLASSATPSLRWRRRALRHRFDMSHEVQMNRSISNRSLASIVAVSVAACSGGNLHSPPPLASIPLPSGGALHPFSSTDPTRAAPAVIASGPGGSAFVALTNLDDSFNPGGPGMLVRVQPETGATTVILLGGADDHACTN